MTELPHVHITTNDQILARSEFLDIANSLMEYPIALHLRGPSTSGLQLYSLATALKSPKHEGTIVVNDRVDVAVAAGVTSVHLPERGLPPNRVKETFGRDLIVGVSAHSCSSAETAIELGADYVFLGPIWTTASHPDRSPLGATVLRGVSGKVVAIGGVRFDRVSSCVEAGAYGIAVISEVWDATNPASVTQALCDIFQQKSN